MKRMLAVLCAALLCFGCGCGQGSQKTQLTVFAAASLEESLTQLGELYMEDHADVELVFNFDSSGTLRTQILEGARCDVFLSAGQSQMDDLGALARGRFDLLHNMVVLAVPAGNPANITSFSDLKTALEDGTVLLAMGNADVPVGQYSQKILQWFGLPEEILAPKGCLTYGSNAREVTTQVAEGMVDCGIIYATDAVSAGLTVVDAASAEMCGQVVYPAAVIDGTEHGTLAEDFLTYLTGDEASAVFASVGFAPNHLTAPEGSYGLVSSVQFHTDRSN